MSHQLTFNILEYLTCFQMIIQWINVFFFPPCRWLMKEGTIRDAIVDTKNQNYLILEVILSTADFAKFKHRFGNMTVSLEDIQ